MTFNPVIWEFYISLSVEPPPPPLKNTTPSFSPNLPLNLHPVQDPLFKAIPPSMLFFRNPPP